MLNKLRHCQFCGHYTITRFCCDRCKQRYSQKQAALKAPTVMGIVGHSTRKKKIDELVYEWDEDHYCPEECNCDPSRMCEVCVGWQDECKEEMVEEYREALEKMTPEELEKEYKEPSW